MQSIDAVFTNGVFKPIGSLSLPENQRVRLIIEASESGTLSDWLDSVRAFQSEIAIQHGLLPDSTRDIAADRQRHE